MYEVALKILEKIEENEYKAYIVGGYPRDRYIGIKSNDIDICTNALVKDLKKIFNNIDSKYEKYGNCILSMNNYNYQITTFRKEKYLDNRNNVEIEFIDDLRQDLERRDFTINTLCIDKNGNYIDLLNSTNDIDNKIIKLVGNIEKLKDDPLRILRAIRFAGNLNFRLDNCLIDGIKKYGNLVKKLNKNKVNEELDKMNDNSIQLLKEFDLL